MDNRLTVSLSLQGTSTQTLELPMPQPWIWTEQDAEQLLAALYAALKTNALYRLTLREGEPDHERQLFIYQLEVVCDTGTARTPPLALSSEG